MTLDDYRSSPMIADPHRLFDCCLESDGACAVVVTTEERARDLAKKPVEILSSVQGAPKGYAFGPFTNANVADEFYATGGCEPMARRLFAKAGLGPGDVDVAQIYDHFTGCVLMQIEDYGFCGRGEGGPSSRAARSPGTGKPAHQHPRWEPLRSLHPRAQSRGRGSAIAARRIDQSRGRRPGVPGHEWRLRAVERGAAGREVRMGERFFPDTMPSPLADAITLPWWRAAAEHRLVAQRCTSCGQTRLPPAPCVPGVAAKERTGWSSPVAARSTPTRSCTVPSPRGSRCPPSSR